MIMSKKNINTFLIFWLTIFAFTYLYYFLKAYFVPLFGDEAATFFFYAFPADYLPFTSHPGPNNHFLNSFLTSIFYQLFGSDKLVLRLGSLMFYPIYFIYSYKISTQLKSSLLQWALMSALILSHNFTEFFITTRGYGMSMALLLGLIFHLKSYVEKGDFKNLLAVLLLNFLMLSANLSLLIIALITFVILFFILISKKHSIKDWLIFLIMSLSTLALFISISFYFREVGQLYYGNAIGFWETSVKSSIILIFNSYQLWIAALLVIGFILIVYNYLYSIIKTHLITFITDSKMIIAHFLLGNIIAIYLMNILLDINYPEDRTAMHLYLLFLLSFIYILDNQKITNYKWIKYLSIPLFLLPLHFLNEINLKYTRCYIEDRLPERFYKQVVQDQMNQDYTPIVGGYRTRGMSWYYQNYQNKGDLPFLFWTQYPDTISDYMIVELQKYPELKAIYDSLDFDAVNKRYLVKRSTPLKRTLIYDSENTSFTGITENEYIGIWEIQGDSLNNEQLVFEIDIVLSAQEKPFDCWVVASASDSLGNSTQYEYAGLTWARSELNKSEFKFSIPLINTSKLTTKKVVYLWNVKKKPLDVIRNRVKVYKLN